VKFGAVNNGFLRHEILVDVAQGVFPLKKLYRIRCWRMGAPVASRADASEIIGTGSNEICVAVVSACFYERSSGLQATERQMQKRGASAPGVRA
jgi:hypothetical protein